ncbi:hypothetical protein ACIRU3_12385 [Streptomyces sp. NPDC101151]|uniref:hypothetical protein n=1 Tax=Streptomyces sp. NPDC101151 TaxID=3366115 RepID=UPI00381AE2B9
MVQDTQGVQITLKADIELPKDIKAGIDLAYQYQHTVATINATSTLETNTLGVDPGTAGRLIFQPRIIHTTGQWVALYPKNTDGYTLWSTESVRQPYLQTWSPELVAATGEADGQWKVQLIDCSTLP